MSFQQRDPGLDLSGIGMPGCRLHVGMPFAQPAISVAGARASLTLQISSDPTFAGTNLYAMAAVIGAINVQPLMVVTSNGADLRLDVN